MTTTAALLTKVLAGRDYRLLAAALVISALGDGVAVVAVTYAILEATGSLSSLGWVLGARYGCLGVFLMLGGVLGDRGSRIRILVFSDVARALTQCLMAAALLVGDSPVWVYIVLQGVYGTAEAFFGPSARGVVPQLVKGEDLQAANAVSEMTFNVSRVFGPAIGGVLVMVADPRGAIALDALSFLVSAYLVSRIHLPRVRTSGRRVLTDLAEGWAVVRRHQWLSTSIATFTLFGALTVPGMMVLGPVVSWRGLGGVTGWTIFTTAFGFGALVGSLVAMGLPVPRPGLVLMSALAVAAIRPATFVVGWSIPGVAAYSFVAGAAMALAGITWYTVLQSRLPNALLSRVSAIDDFGTYLLTPVGYFLAAPIAASLGLGLTLILLALIPAAAAIAAMCVPEVRRLENLTSVSPAGG